MIYDSDYFLDYFSPIPEAKWRVGGWGDYDVHCAGGHCGVKRGMITKAQYPKMFWALEELLRSLKITQRKYCKGDSYSDYITVIINDGYALEYNQETPKQRILAALYDIKKMLEEQEVKWSVATADAQRSERSQPKINIQFPEYHKPVEETLEGEIVEANL